MASGVGVRGNANFSFGVGVMQILALGNPKFTNMLVSPTLNSGVRGIAQRQPLTPGIMHRSGK